MQGLPRRKNAITESLFLRAADLLQVREFIFHACIHTNT